MRADAESTSSSWECETPRECIPTEGQTQNPSHVFSASGGTRTHNLQIRSLVRYPLAPQRRVLFDHEAASVFWCIFKLVPLSSTQSMVTFCVALGRLGSRTG